jgi:Secretion system C-terminal sorting domain
MKKALYFMMAIACWALSPVPGLVHTTVAQTKKTPAKGQQLRVKMIRTENGKTQVLDTTITVDGSDSHLDLLQKLRQKELGPGKGERRRIKLLSPGDTLSRHLPGLMRLPGLLPPGEVDSMKVIYFKKGRPTDTVMVKDVRAFKMQGFPGLLTDSLLELEHFILPEMHLNMEALDSLFRDVEVWGQVGIEGKELPFIVESEEVFQKKDGKKADASVPAFSESRIVIIRGEEDSRKKVPAVGKTQKSRKITAPGLREDLKVRSVQVYPNPSKGRFNISLEPARTGNLTIQVLDDKGKVIHGETFQNFKGRLHKEIDISGSRNGIYYLRIVQGKSYLTRKLVIR